MSAPPADGALAAEAELAAALADAPVVAMERAGGGRNSRVFRVETVRGTFALKRYPSRAGDPRDRLGVEARALTLMAEHGIETVPRLVASDPERGAALLSWLDAAPPGAVGEPDIDQAVAFLGACHRLRHAPAARDMPPASEACLSGAEIERQIDARLHRLQAAGDGRLAAFLAAELVPSRAQALAAAKAAMARAGLDFAAVLPPERRTLIPADFGFHNSLRRGDGSLLFLDFEYFGWDDPVKLIADVMLHPGTPVAPDLGARFRRQAVALYGDDPAFAIRLRAFHRLFALRWALILLNEFLPDRWRRRVDAGEAGGWDAVKIRQLARARQMLARIGDADHGC